MPLIDIAFDIQYQNRPDPRRNPTANIEFWRRRLLGPDSDFLGKTFPKSAIMYTKERR